MRENTRLKVFNIELLADQEEYHLGDSISGAIVVEPRNGQIIAKLRVGIHGIAKVTWVSGSGKSHTSMRHDSSKQVSNAVHYFDIERSVYENRRASAPSGPDLMRARTTSRLGLLGLEEFPFVFKLPERGAPATWSGLYGMIRYWIDAVVEVGGKDCFREDIQRGVVITPSLNAILPGPLAQAQKFPITGLACVPTSVSASIQTNKAAYLPGEVVQLKVDVKNASPWQISSHVYLLNTQIFMGKNGVQKLVKDVLVKVNGNLVRASSDAQWAASLTIPGNALPSLLDCTIIKSRYTVLLRLRVRSVLSQYSEISTPIIIIQRRTETGELPLDLPVVHHELLLEEKGIEVTATETASDT